jgi:hypothetical protein
MRKLTPLLVAALTVVPATAGAQSFPDNPSQQSAQDALPDAGDVSDRSGALLTRAPLRLNTTTPDAGATYGSRISFSPNGVQQAAAPKRDSLVNGMLIGLAVGASVGRLWAFSDYEDDAAYGPDLGAGGSCAVDGALLGGIGLGIGAGVDALIGRAVGNRAPGRRPTFVPAIGRRGAALMGIFLW